MVYTSRILPAEEWDRLPTEVTHTLNPDFSYVAVVEMDGEIVARWAALNTVHLEGLFIEEAHRQHPAVARQLMTTMFQTLKGVGVVSVVTIIQDPGVQALAERVGFVVVPGAVYRLDL